MAILSQRNCQQMCLVAIGHDGNGSNSKTSGRFFQVVHPVPRIKSVKTDFVLFVLSKFISFCFLSSLKAFYA